MQTLTPPIRCQTIEWLGTSLRVPDDWEISRHNLNPLRGALTFVDRRRQRLQFRWTQCRKPPLLERMFADHRSAQLKQDPDAQMDEFRHGSWQGLVHRFGAQQTLIRAARYDAIHQLLLEATFSQDDHQPQLSHELLDSIQTRCRPFFAHRLTAFGIRTVYPPAFRAVSAKIQVGRTTIALQQYKAPGSEKPRPGEAALRKLGMADGWLRDDLSTFLKTENPKSRFQFEEKLLNESMTGGKAVLATIARSIEPGPRLKRFAGRLRIRQDLLWHSEPHNAVFHIQTLSFKRHPIEPDQFELQPVEEVPL